jgi:hypothetical protein
MGDVSTYESEVIHQFKNHLALIVGYCGVLLAELAEGDSKRADVLEMDKAARAAMALMPELTTAAPRG